LLIFGKTVLQKALRRVYGVTVAPLRGVAEGPVMGLFLTAMGRDAKVTYIFSPLFTELNIRYD